MATKVGAQGQVVIEDPIREALGVEPGYMAVQTLVGDHVEIRFFPPDHQRSLKGVLASYVRRSATPDEWPKVRDQAWPQAALEDWNGKDRS